MHFYILSVVHILNVHSNEAYIRDVLTHSSLNSLDLSHTGHTHSTYAHIVLLYTTLSRSLVFSITHKDTCLDIYLNPTPFQRAMYCLQGSALEHPLSAYGSDITAIVMSWAWLAVRTHSRMTVNKRCERLQLRKKESFFLNIAFMLWRSQLPEDFCVLNLHTEDATRQKLKVMAKSKPGAGGDSDTKHQHENIFCSYGTARPRLICWRQISLGHFRTFQLQLLLLSSHSICCFLSLVEKSEKCPNETFHRKHLD